MARLHNTRWTIASLPTLSAADDFNHPESLHVRFQELTQLWVIDHSLLCFLEFCQLVTTHLFCWGLQDLVTVAFIMPYRSSFTFLHQ